MRLFLSCLAIFWFISCQTSENHSSCEYYPSKIKKLNAEDLYDSARWTLYTWLGTRKEYDYYYGQMDLHFTNVVSRNDTLTIYFQFRLPDTLSSKQLRSEAVANVYVAFRTDTKKKFWAFVYPFENFSENLEPGDKELDSPPSAEAMSFIKSHRDSLNSCYRELAIKMKVIGR